MTSIARIRSRAYVLISVLICLTLAMMLGTAWLRTIGLERAHIRADVRGAQAELLAASGMSRAQARLTNDGGYTGEIWRVGGDALDGSNDGAVAIAIAAVPDQLNARRIQVVADYPASETLRARRSREAIYLLPLQNTREEVSP